MAVLAAALVLASSPRLRLVPGGGALTPWVTVVGYETLGHRHLQDYLASAG